MIVNRDLYIDALWERRHNGLIKIITGVRRCGKSFLLFRLFVERLRSQGVPDDHIICLALDDFANRRYQSDEALYEFVTSKIVDHEQYYVLLDEIQLVSGFEAVLNGFLHISNLDVYVTGSNSRFLSSDIVTEFRGRGDELRVRPLSFAEYYSTFDGSVDDAWERYSVYGGMPGLLEIANDKRKVAYLQQLFAQTYLQDIINRYNLRGNEEIGELMNVIASSAGSLTNTLTLTNTFNSSKRLHLSQDTVGRYLAYFQDSFLIEKAQRYDVRGRHYISTPMKYYFVDPGLRNACLNFRQLDKGCLMETIIYNELRLRGYLVDVGCVEVNRRLDGKNVRKQLEVDFVCNRGSQRIYIQSAYELWSEEKRSQEKQSMLNIKDSFRKIIIQRESIVPYYDDDGVWNLGLSDFLTHPEMLD